MPAWIVLVHFSFSTADLEARAPGKQTEYQEKLYNDAKYAATLDKWGEGTTWTEVIFLLAGCTDKVLDIACGTGRNIVDLQRSFGHLEVHGTDISPLLLQLAEDKGIPASRLKVADNGRPLAYSDRTFDCAYSIGSFEHFTLEGLDTVIAETVRVTRRASFHHVPVSPTTDIGWINNTQPQWRMSIEWWLRRFKRACESVSVLHSRWKRRVEIGVWICCYNERHTQTS